MHQKELIRSAWRAAGLYDEEDPRLQEFLAQLDKPEMCWAEMARLLRRSYGAYKDKVVQPILARGDTLTRLAIIRAASEADDEARLVERFISASNPVEHETELTAIAQRALPRFDKALKRKRGLTAPVREALAARPATPRRRKPRSLTTA